jgi:hypothetical protein
MILALKSGLYLILAVALWWIFALMFLVPGVMDLTRMLMIAGGLAVAVPSSIVNGWLTLRSEASPPTVRKLLGTIPMIILLVVLVVITIFALGSDWKKPENDSLLQWQPFSLMKPFDWKPEVGVTETNSDITLTMWAISL